MRSQLYDAYDKASEDVKRLVRFSCDDVLYVRTGHPDSIASHEEFIKSRLANGTVKAFLKDFFERQYFAELVCDNGHFCLVVVVRPDFIVSADSSSDKPCILIFDSLSISSNGAWFGSFDRIAKVYNE